MAHIRLSNKVIHYLSQKGKNMEAGLIRDLTGMVATATVSS